MPAMMSVCSSMRCADECSSVHCPACLVFLLVCLLIGLQALECSVSHGFQSPRASLAQRCWMSCTEKLVQCEGAGVFSGSVQPTLLVLTPCGPHKPSMPAPPFFSALAGLSLNGLTILSFCKNPELRTPSHLLVLSLALADSGISLNALVAATSSLLRYCPSPVPGLGWGPARA